MPQFPCIETADEVSAPTAIDRDPREGETLPGIVGTSKPMLDVYSMVARVAPTTSTVLIQGETGTGKELIARAIHTASRRSDHPFVPVDCSALAEGLLESELFGHVKGAFTGALGDRRGLFEMAGGGTCFLDEIGEISACVQAKLLRVLQEREVRRVGGTDTFKVDVRVIAATNKDLGALVAEGKFREDLFYRLSVVTIMLPPLRERREDIPFLADHFLATYLTANDQPECAISPDAMTVLIAHEWPGNVRELQHAIERAAALRTTTLLRPEDLPPRLTDAVLPGATTSGPLKLQEVVRGHLRRVLNEARWNKKLAAQLLGIHRRTLYRLTKRYGIWRDGQE
ncbi:MAG TPA: sigma-54 dependent transcriptional regulator [Candidatus Methylomirabilis sp.]|nr:sigma-54 dependent transcriptional regulator [Candidatus Methylomirabilis sp.]